MRVWVGASSAVARHVVVTCPDDAVGDELASGVIAARLADSLGAQGDALCVGGRLLEDTELLGCPPLLDGVSVRLVERAGWRPPTRPTVTAATEIAVIGGPEAGRTHALSGGSHTVGRAGADLSIADPTLSRVHLRIDVDPTGLTVTDLGSENGTVLDGVPVGQPTAIRAGSMLRLGRTTLLLRAARVLPATTAPRRDGTLVVSRSSSPLTDPPRVRIEAPQPPEPPSRRRVPWVAAFLPVPVGLLLAWFLGPYLLLFALMSPLMLLGNVLSDRFGARRGYAEETRRHTLALERCQARVASALAAERLWRETTTPDLAAIARAALTPGGVLWSRELGSPARIVVRLGRGRVRSRVTWVEEHPEDLVIDDAAVGVDLCTMGSLSIEGPSADAVLDALLGQLVVLHSPADLQVLTTRTAWGEVPHVRTGSASALLRELGMREPGTQEPGTREMGTRGARGDAESRQPNEPWTVLALSVSDLSSQDLDTLSAICREGRRHQVLTIVTGARITAARASLVTTRSGPATLTASAPETESTASEPVSEEILADGVGPAWVGRVAAALTPLRDSADARAVLPRSVGLATVLADSDRTGEAAGVGGRRATHPLPRPLHADDIERRWLAADDGAWVTLGVGHRGPHRFDLSTVGPHALIGGTTGAGKSELLRTLVASLAAGHPPDDVAVVLVDYKGGSAFAGLEDLPHIIGVVTDLDPALTQRALTSLRAEVHRRERLFAACGASDIVGYRKASRRAGSDLTHLARLILVVDEFRALADELPEFVTGLVRLAAVGRSLGIHLVLATQRPAGVVTADMRANLSLRIALRMRDRTDSQDVIESDAAARLDRSTPGRALIRSGTEPLETIQTATVEDVGSAAPLSVEVHWRDGTILRREFPVTTRPAPTGIVAAISAAAQQAGRAAPPSPWLPALGTHLEWSPDRPPTAWALLDEPAAQRQRHLLLDLPTMAPTAIAGSVGSGRTVAARTIALAALAAGQQTHVYAVADRTGPLADLDGARGFAGLLERTDAARVAWFVDRLAAEVRERQTRPRTHHLLVVIDGWEVLAEACDRLDHGALTDRLLAVLREGHGLGIRAIVTGDRAALSGRVGRAFPQRYLLRPSDDTDLVLAGLRPEHVPTHWPPGRMLRVEDGAHLQVLLRSPGSVSSISSIESVSGISGVPTDVMPWRVVDLPSALSLSELPPDPRRPIVLGLDGGDGGWCVIGGQGRRRVVITGSPGSGRSTALAGIALQAARAGRAVCVVGDEHGDLARLTQAGLRRLGWDQDEDLIALRRKHPDLVVLADDIERHLDAPAVPALEQISDLAERDGGLVAVSGDAAVLAMRPRGLGPAVARGRVTLVLGSPTPMDGDLAGQRLPRVARVIPGRGWLVAGRTATPIQVATPGSTTGAAAGYASP